MKEVEKVGKLMEMGKHGFLPQLPHLPRPLQLPYLLIGVIRFYE
jgi:hypothetical protein